MILKCTSAKSEGGTEMETYLDKRRSPYERAVDLCARMTTMEKIGQTQQQLYGFHTVQKQDGRLLLNEDFLKETERFGGLGFLYGLHRADPWSGRNYENGLRGKDAIRAYNMVQQYTLDHSRFHIPLAVTAEYSHGHQALDGYMLPVNLAIGCSFNPGLLERASAVCAKQERRVGIRLSNASVLDVLRDPRWGRSEECFSEDPYLASQMAASVIHGMGTEGVSVIAKHLCAQGETTGGKNASPARIGERELREIHLPPAEAAVRAGAAAFMAAYNEIDGIPCHANPWLLKHMLRDEFGFDGFVVADGCAIDRLDSITGDNVSSGALAMCSGVDVGLWDQAFARLDEAITQNKVSEERLDEAVIKILTFKFASGLFDDPLLPEDTAIGRVPIEEAPESLQLAEESAVLLKNEGHLLPLNVTAGGTIGVIGPRAHDLYGQMGDYTPPMLPENGCTVLEGVKKVFSSWSILTDDGSDPVRAADLASRADITLLALGGSSSRFTHVVFDQNGEAVERPEDMDCGEGVDCGNLQLPGNQSDLFKAVRAQSKHLVTLIIAGRPYAIPQIAELTDALLISFYPGSWGGLALAKLLAGQSIPSGRLAVSIPYSAAELPVYYNKKRTDRIRTYVDAKDHKEALFAFGEGMGYAEAQYGAYCLENLLTTCPEPDNRTAVKLHFEVCNPCASSVAAVPMLFITDLEADVTRRALELKAFDKILLYSGEKRTVTLQLTDEDLAVWNRNMEREVQTGHIHLTLKDGFRTLWEETFMIPNKAN